VRHAGRDLDARQAPARLAAGRHPRDPVPAGPAQRHGARRRGRADPHVSRLCGGYARWLMNERQTREQQIRARRLARERERRARARRARLIAVAALLLVIFAAGAIALAAGGGGGGGSHSAAPKAASSTHALTSSVRIARSHTG